MAQVNGRMGRINLPRKEDWVVLRPVVWYLIIASLWILLSDWVLSLFVTDPKLITDISILKGWGYVLVTSGLLYYWIQKSFSDLMRLNRELQMMEFSVDHAFDPAYWINKSGHVVYVNQAACKRLGYTKDELLKMSIFDIDPEYHPNRWKKHWEETKRDKSQVIETRHKTKNGEIFPVEVTINFGAYGGEEYHFSFARDLSERKSTAQRLMTILREMGDGVMLIDSGKKVILMNPAMEKLTGVSEKAALGLNLNMVVNLVNEQDLKPDHSVEKFLDKKGPYEPEANLLLVRSDGKQMAVDYVATPIIENGINNGGVIVMRDVTKARDVDRLKSEFVSLASHQLRTPLTGIKWFVELLLGNKEEPLSSQQSDYLKQLKESNDRLIALVNDLLNVSRIEKGMEKMLKLEKTDLIPLVEEAIKEKKPQATVKMIVMKKVINLPKVMVKVDKIKIKEVLENLLDNAIKYSAKNALVTVTMEGVDHQARIVIKDNGIGIPEREQGQVFQRFFRASNVNNLSESFGTGLGLYLVKKVVEAHGGKIWFVSEENKGSTFYLQIPY